MLRLKRTFLGIKRLGGCFGRFTCCGGRAFCAEFVRVGSLPAGGPLGAGTVRLEFATEDPAEGLEVLATPGDGDEICETEGLRAGTSPGGRGVEANFEGELFVRCCDVELLVPCGPPMLRAGTSVAGMACDSTVAFFGGLGGDFRGAFRFGSENRPTSA
jgi:hypothetical protein